MDIKELTEFCLELIDHLDYTGWGDSWERECSENLRERAEAFKEKYGY